MTKIEENGNVAAEEKDTAKEAATKTETKPPKDDSKKKIKELESRLTASEEAQAELEKKAAEGEDKYLRLAAEYDNFRKRSQKEREGIYTEAYAEALAALFPVVDNLERAAQYADGENVARGVEMTLKSVKDTFEKLGVTEIDPVGKEFDPNFHNAVMHIEDPELGESVVVEVLQKGYLRGDRVLRYAMVKVAN